MMQTISTHCPHCHAEIEIEPSMIDETLQCPSCQQDFVFERPAPQKVLQSGFFNFLYCPKLCVILLMTAILVFAGCSVFILCHAVMNQKESEQEIEAKQRQLFADCTEITKKMEQCNAEYNYILMVFGFAERKANSMISGLSPNRLALQSCAFNPSCSGIGDLRLAVETVSLMEQNLEKIRHELENQFSRILAPILEEMEFANQNQEKLLKMKMHFPNRGMQMKKDFFTNQENVSRIHSLLEKTSMKQLFNSMEKLSNRRKLFQSSANYADLTEFIEIYLLGSDMHLSSVRTMPQWDRLTAADRANLQQFRNNYNQLAKLYVQVNDVRAKICGLWNIDKSLNQLEKELLDKIVSCDEQEQQLKISREKTRNLIMFSSFGIFAVISIFFIITTLLLAVFSIESTVRAKGGI